MQNILIVGASRGIGLALVRAYLARGERVHAVVRKPGNTDLAALAAQYPEHLQQIVCDLTDSAAGQRMAQALEGQTLDVALFNAGISGPRHQDVTRIEDEEIAQLFLTNAIAPLRAARALLPRLAAHATLAFMSSQMGSVALARSASMPLYGASKAALNSLLQSWSQAEDRPAQTLLALHPGWVRTDMGGESAPLEASESAAGLLQTLDAHQDRGGCHFVDYLQQPLAW